MLCIPYNIHQLEAISFIGSQFSHPLPLIFCLANESMIYFYYLFMFFTCAICTMYEHRVREAFYSSGSFVSLKASYCDADTLYYCSIKMQIKPVQSLNGNIFVYI